MSIWNKFLRATRDLVWTAMFAVVTAVAAVAAAFMSSNTEVVLALGMSSLTFAILSPRNY